MLMLPRLPCPWTLCLEDSKAFPGQQHSPGRGTPAGSPKHVLGLPLCLLQWDMPPARQMPEPLNGLLMWRSNGSPSISQMTALLTVSLTLKIH